MRYLFFFSSLFISFFLIPPLFSHLYAQYPTPTPATYCIEGHVYLDANQNGAYTGTTAHYGETGDIGLASQTIEILNNSTGLPAATGNTGPPEGRYLTCGIPAWGYTVRYTPPSGSGLTPTSPSDVIIQLNQNVRIDFAVTDSAPGGSTPTPTPTPTYTIYSRVFADDNADGAYNGSDVILAGQPVDLYYAPDTYRGTATTDSTPGSGYAVMNLLPADDWSVRYTAPSGWRLTTVGAYSVSTPPDNQTLYFGIRKPPTPVFSPQPSASCVGNNPRVNLGWSSPGATYFEVYDSIGGLIYNGGATIINYDGYPTSYIGRQYQFQVRAYWSQGETDYAVSAWSNTITIPDCYYSIGGTVYLDHARDQVANSPDTGYGGATITLSGTATGTTPSNASGIYSFQYLLEGNYATTLTIPSGYVATGPNPPTYSFTPLAGVVSTANFGIVQIFTVPAPASPGNTGTVYVDHDRNGSYTSGDVGYSGATLTLSGTREYGSAISPTTFTSQTTSSVANGTYSFPNPTTAYLYQGTYRVTFTNPNTTRYQSPTTMFSDFYLPPSASGPSFGIIPRYEISGYVFDDQSKDRVKNGVEPGMSGLNLRIIGPAPSTASIPVTTDSTGKFTSGITLYEGQYTVELLSQPDGYRMTTPQNGPPPSFVVTVGRTCAPIANCISAGLPFTASDIQNLNFGMTNCMPWFQFIGSNGRIDGSFFNDGSTQNGFSDPIPDTATAACGGANASIANPPGQPDPGIIFSDGIDATTFGQGQASPQNWQVDSSYAPGTINTSYGYMLATIRQSGIDPLDLADYCSLGSCSLTTLESGIYQTDDEVTFSASVISGNKQVVILIDDELHIAGTVIVPAGNSLVVSTSGDIDVLETVGNVDGDIESRTAHVEGFYSTDRSFIMRGSNTSCAADANVDGRLNIAGSIVANAANTGGGIQNLRDLGIGNRSCPAFSIIARPDFLLTAPEFIKRKADVWKEVAP